MYRILYVSPFAYSISGPDQSLLTYLRHRDKESFEPWVAVPYQRSVFWDLYEESGAKVIPMPIEAISRTIHPGHWYACGRTYRQAVHMLKQVIINKEISLVHSNIETVLSGARAAYLSKRPAVHHFRNITSSRPRWAYDMLTKFIKYHNQHFIVTSEAIRETLGSRIPVDQVSVIPNAVDIGLYENGGESRASILGELGIDASCTIVATIGRIDPRKGYDVLVNVAGQLRQLVPRVRWLFIGNAQSDGEKKYREQLQSAIHSKGLASDIYLLGYRADVPRVLRAVDIFAFASFSEGFGRAVVEAMAAALPVVAVATGGVRELVTNGQTGLLLPSHDPNSFAEALLYLINNRHRAHVLGENGKQRVLEVFNPDRMARRIESVYWKVMSTQSGGSST